jgi:hypothetical protein
MGPTARVYVEAEADSATVDVLNSSDAPIVADLADVIRTFRVVVGDEKGAAVAACRDGPDRWV